MEGIDEIIKDLDKSNEEDIQKLHEASKYFREIADLIDELAVPEKTKEEIENIVAKMIVIGIKLKTMN